MSLLDKKIENYNFEWEKGRFGNPSSKAMIEADGKIMGRLQTKGFITKTTSLSDENDRILISSIKKHTIGDRYQVENSDGKFLGNVNCKISFTSRNPIATLKNEYGKEVLYINYISKQDGLYDVKTNVEKTIADFTLYYDSNCNSQLLMKDLEFDREKLFAIVISFFSSRYDYTTGG